MTAFASTDVTVTISKRDVVGREKRITGTIAYGDGSLTYATGGVPMPAVSYFRLKSINRMHFSGPGNGYVYEYDYTNNKILMYYGNYDASDGVLIEPNTVATAAVTLYFEAWGKS